MQCSVGWCIYVLYSVGWCMCYAVSILSIHCSIGSVPVGVQCPQTSSLGEFSGYWDWLWCPGLLPVLVCCPSPFLSLFHIGVFSFTLLPLPVNFLCVSSLRVIYLHPSVDPSLM